MLRQFVYFLNTLILAGICNAKSDLKTLVSPNTFQKLKAKKRYRHRERPYNPMGQVYVVRWPLLTRVGRKCIDRESQWNVASILKISKLYARTHNREKTL